MFYGDGSIWSNQIKMKKSLKNCLYVTFATNIFNQTALSRNLVK